MCGKPLVDLPDSSHRGARHESELDSGLDMLGFTIGNSLLHTSEAEWSTLRELVHSHRTAVVKREIITVSTQDVYFTQRSCSPTFRNHLTLSGLTRQLKDGVVDPLEADFLVLDVIQVLIRQGRRRGAFRSMVYYTLDHRRLKCMKDAGCQQVCRQLCQQSYRKRRPTL